MFGFALVSRELKNAAAFFFYPYGELPSMHGTDAVSHLCKTAAYFYEVKNTVVSGLSQKSVTFSTAYEFKIKSLYRNDLILNIA